MVVHISRQISEFKVYKASYRTARATQRGLQAEKQTDRQKDTDKIRQRQIEKEKRS